MRDVCLACGRPIVAVHERFVRRGAPISLTYVWVHYSWWANRTHAAIPKGGASDE